MAGSYGLNGVIDLNELNKNLLNIKGLMYNNVTIDVNDVNKRINELPAIVKLNGYIFQITNNGEVLLPQSLESITKDNYGDYIDLGQNVVKTSEPTDDWRILYNDKNGNIYAILTDYLPNSNIAVTNSGLNVVDDTIYNVNSTTTRIDLLSHLNHESAWNCLIPDTLVSKGAKVTGAITGEIIMASYNEKYNIDPVKNYTSYPFFYIDDDNTKGIDTLYIPCEGTKYKCVGYWLASPDKVFGSYVWDVHCEHNRVEHDEYTYNGLGICPVVSIPSTILVKSKSENGNTIWNIIE